MKNYTNPPHRGGFFRLSATLFSITLSSVLLFLSSCTNEFDSIGRDLIDSELIVNSTDTITITGITQKEDSIPTSLANINLLGYINNPDLGQSLSSIYTEAIPRQQPSFNILDTLTPDQIVIDSAILALDYLNYFGDSLAQINLDVFELSDTLPSGIIYSNREIPAKEMAISLQSIFNLPRDSVYLGNDTSNLVKPHLRIPLSEGFARKFTDNPDITDNFTNNDDYREFFKGLKIEAKPSSGSGVIGYFNLNSPLSAINIYYRNIEDTITRTFELPLNTPESRSYSFFDNFDFQGIAPEIGNQINNTDPQIADSLLFLQSMANFRIKLELPYVEDFINEDMDIAINSARLILHVDETYLQDTLGIAGSLILLKEDPNSGGDNPELVGLTDQALGAGYFGGILDEEKMEYSFNFTQHLQEIINGETENTPLYLRVTGSVENADRVVLTGPGRTHQDKKMRVEIKYTELIEN